MSKQQPKDKAFQWSESEQRILLVICREYHKKNGVDTHFNWGEIAEKFEAQTGRKLTGKEAKNKFDYMKSIWRAWTDLRFNETGAGWNESTQTIDATEEWWARKLAESDRYKRFKKKPVDPELSELWDSVYNSICATGNNCVSANMDRSRAATANDNIDDYLVSDDDNNEEGFTEPHVTTLTQEATPGGSQPSSALGKRSTQPIQKRKKKRSSAAAQYKEHMASFGNTNDKVLSLLEEEIGGTPGTDKGKGHDLEDAIDVVDRLVKEGMLEVATSLWCYAVDELNNDVSRRLFMILKTDEEKLAWLKYKFEKQA